MPISTAATALYSSGSTLCFGGTFNPIHHGHLLCARAAAEAKGFAKVLLIPSGRPPHKASAPIGSDVAAAEDRLALCRLAVVGDPLFEVSDIELRRSDPSYTITTARTLRQHGFPSPIHWLIGADTVARLPTWHQSAALLAEIHFLVMARPGAVLDWSSIPQPFQVLKAQVVIAPSIEISATDLRRRIQDGRPIQYLTPPPVADYIARHNLYR